MQILALAVGTEPAQAGGRRIRLAIMQNPAFFIKDNTVYACCRGILSCRFGCAVQDQFTFGCPWTCSTPVLLAMHRPATVCDH
jgi:hypothetical protein